jgi:hypothetical protein
MPALLPTSLHSVTPTPNLHPTPATAGFLWDREGHLVTNYHVLGATLKGLSPQAQAKQPIVARVTLLGADNQQQAYTAKLIGGGPSQA